MQIITIQNGPSTMTVNPQGGYVVSWKIDGKDILYQGSELKRTGIPILFPNFGKSNVLPQHGFGRNTEWKITEQTDDEVSMLLSNVFIAPEMMTLYPHEFMATIKVALTADGDFIYELFVKNDGLEAMPISPGIHPYWTVDHEKKSEVTIDEIQEFKANEIDWSTNPPDTAYPFDGRVSIHFPDKILSIEDTTDSGPENRLMQVWSQGTDKPDYNFICFEPITRDNFDLENNPIMIEPGETWSMRLEFCVTWKD